MSVTQFNTPILFLVFNRLDTAKQVLAAIRRVQPSSLYIAADGPRSYVEGEAEKTKIVRDYLISHIDWSCEVKTLFREQNLGCREAVSGALDWFFLQEPEGIILEDDCIPVDSFFPFAEELLARYRDDVRIMAISGDYFAGNAYRPQHSYYFSCYNHCWGWASWRRAWNHYDHTMSQWSALRNTDWLLAVGDGNRDFQKYWIKIFDQICFENALDTWALIWTFSCWAQNGLSVLPSKNLVRNIGFGPESTHTNDVFSDKFNTASENLVFPLSHPPSVVKNYVADKWTFENHFSTPFRKKVSSKLSRLKSEFLC